eukprot:scpid2273/ scgid2315/ Ubiquitin carboxyl-terminal hydrolase 34; Deubiquitinating enzyme 34; Ubiquitin thioesterase 34; Ubiquitin-specific-processing protease 34
MAGSRRITGQCCQPLVDELDNYLERVGDETTEEQTEVLTSSDIKFVTRLLQIWLKRSCPCFGHRAEDISRVCVDFVASAVEKLKLIAKADLTAGGVQDDLTLLRDMTEGMILLVNEPMLLLISMPISNRKPLQTLSEEEYHQLQGLCYMSSSSGEMSPYLGKIMCTLYTQGFFEGISAITQLPHAATHLPSHLVLALVDIVSLVREHLQASVCTSVIRAMRAPVFKYFISLSDDKLRCHSQFDFIERLQARLKMPGPLPPDEGQLALALTLRYLRSEFINIRFSAMHSLLFMIRSFQFMDKEIVRFHANSASRELAVWMVDNRIVELLFGPDLHVELVKLCPGLLLFMATQGCMQRKQLESIWRSTRIQHSCRAAHDALLGIYKSLSRDCHQFLIEEHQRLSPSTMTALDVQLLAYVTQELMLQQRRARQVVCKNNNNVCSTSNMVTVKPILVPVDTAAILANQPTPESGELEDADDERKSGEDMDVDQQADVAAGNTPSASPDVGAERSRSPHLTRSDSVEWPVEPQSGIIAYEKNLSKSKATNMRPTAVIGPMRPTAMTSAMVEDDSDLSSGESESDIDELVSLSPGPPPGFYRRTANLASNLAIQRLLQPPSPGDTEEAKVWPDGLAVLWKVAQDLDVDSGVAKEALVHFIQCLVNTCARESTYFNSFVEECLQNIAANKSVEASLNVLKAIVEKRRLSLQEQEPRIMDSLFQNIETFLKMPGVDHGPGLGVRLHFLSDVFSVSEARDIAVSKEQLAMLFSSMPCQACYHILFAWMTRDLDKPGHSRLLSPDALCPLFTQLMMDVPLDAINEGALSVIQQLISINEGEERFMDQSKAQDCMLIHYWRVVKHAQLNTSLKASQELTEIYVNNDGLDGKDLLERCMTLFETAGADICKEPEESVRLVLRGTNLIIRYFYQFRKRFAYHMRLKELSGELAALPPVGVLQPQFDVGWPIADNHKTFHLRADTLLCELRAEVLHFCRTNPTTMNGIRCDGEEPEFLKICADGSELRVEHDNRQLQELGFTRAQTISVRPVRRASMHRRLISNQSYIPEPPPLDAIPAMILCNTRHVEILVTLLQTLHDHFRASEASQEDVSLMQDLYRVLQSIPVLESTEMSIMHLDVDWSDVLDPNKPFQSNLYLHAISQLCASGMSRGLRKLGLRDLDSWEVDRWRGAFVSSGGMAQLLNFLRSDTLVCPVCSSKSQGNAAEVSTHAEPLQEAQQTTGNPWAASCCPQPVWLQEWRQTTVQYLIQAISCMAPSVQVAMPRPAPAAGKDAAQVQGSVEEIDDDDLPDTEPYDVDAEADSSTDVGNDSTRPASATAASPGKNAALPASPESTRLEQQHRSIFHPVFLNLLEEDNFACFTAILHCIEQLATHCTTNTAQGSVTDLHHMFRKWTQCRTQLLEQLSAFPNLSAWLHTVLVTCSSPSMRTTVSEILLGLISRATKADAASASTRDHVLKFVKCLLAVVDHVSAHNEEAQTLLDFISLSLSVCFDVQMRSLLPDDYVLSQLQRRLPKCDEAMVRLYSDSSRSLTNAVLCVSLLQHCTPSQPATTRRYYQQLFSIFYSALFGFSTARVELTPHLKALKAIHNPAEAHKNVEPSSSDLAMEVDEGEIGSDGSDSNEDCLVRGDLPLVRKSFFRRQIYRALRQVFSKSLELVPACMRHLERYLSAELHPGYAWRYDPQEEFRQAGVPYSGLVNLGATCYMASCLQQLFMVPELRHAILTLRVTDHQPHAAMLRELQGLFVQLSYGTWRAYSPIELSKIYRLAGNLLNVHEQTDMGEFFTDLVSKLEESSPHLARSVNGVCRGKLSSSIVSRDCPHISFTEESFFLVRCPVENMVSLDRSLTSVVSADALEGDNKYICSKCPEGSQRVAADKRTSFRQLPPFLCLNPQRYEFNMILMQKEKVNSYFEFPTKLNMLPYTEQYLLGDRAAADNSSPDRRSGGRNDDDTKDNQQAPVCYDYELVGVTVHTGTADGGHYYSFIRDRYGSDEWYNFNDTEVRPFTIANLEAECYGGQMTTASHSNKPPQEKSNSAYMLFYERCDILSARHIVPLEQIQPSIPASLLLRTAIANTMLEHRSHLFDHQFHEHMGTLVTAVLDRLKQQPSVFGVSLADVVLFSLSYLLELLVHAASVEDTYVLDWFKMTTKHVNGNPELSRSFLQALTQPGCMWLKKMFVLCSNEHYRERFSRLLLCAVRTVREEDLSMYNRERVDGCVDGENAGDIAGGIGLPAETLKDENLTKTSLTGKVIVCLRDLLCTTDATNEHLVEYFKCVHDFVLLGEPGLWLFLASGFLNQIVCYYLNESINEEIFEIILSDQRKVSLSHHLMARLVLELVLRCGLQQWGLTRSDLLAVYSDQTVGEPSFAFIAKLMQKKVDPVTIGHLVMAAMDLEQDDCMKALPHKVSRRFLGNPECRPAIIHDKRMSTSLSVFGRILEAEHAKISGTPLANPSRCRFGTFTTAFVTCLFPSMEAAPGTVLDWLLQWSFRIPALQIYLKKNSNWVDGYLFHRNSSIRAAAAKLLSVLFGTTALTRALAASFHVTDCCQVDCINLTRVSTEDRNVLRALLHRLLNYRKTLKSVVERDNDKSQLVGYFQLLVAVVIDEEDQDVLTDHLNEFVSLWFDVFASDTLSNISYNKQALMSFLFKACHGHEGNLRRFLVLSRNGSAFPSVHIYLNSDDHELTQFNCSFLEAYYGLLLELLRHSTAFAQMCITHENMEFAFKHIVLFPSIYSSLLDVLLGVLSLFAGSYYDDVDSDACSLFREQMLKLFLNLSIHGQLFHILPRVLSLLLLTDADRRRVVRMEKLDVLAEAYYLTCDYMSRPVAQALNNIEPILKVFYEVLSAAVKSQRTPGLVKGFKAFTRRGEFFLNLTNYLCAHSSPDLRHHCLGILNAALEVYGSEDYKYELLTSLLEKLWSVHNKFHQHPFPPVPEGRYFPARGSVKADPGPPSISSIKNLSPEMHIHHTHLQAQRGVDSAYDRKLDEFFLPYYDLVDLVCRKSISQCQAHANIIQAAASVGSLVAIEGSSLHAPHFAKLWVELHSEHGDADNASASPQLDNLLSALWEENAAKEYMQKVLVSERSSLNQPDIYRFATIFYSKIWRSEDPASIIESLQDSVLANAHVLETFANATSAQVDAPVYQYAGDLLALDIIVYNEDSGLSDALLNKLKSLRTACNSINLEAPGVSAEIEMEACECETSPTQASKKRKQPLIDTTDDISPAKRPYFRGNSVSDSPDG